jgi:putative Mg2+ transporter-C (MgtC) family protein
MMQTLPTAEIAVRLASAVLIGTAIGLERMWHHKVAGLKTNTLVTLGAAIFGIISADASFLPNWSASQFSIGVITGIGFLGSGIMIQGGGHIQGINSAATIWVAAATGLACGFGEYTLAILSLIAVVTVQFVHKWIENRSDGNLPK